MEQVALRWPYGDRRRLEYGGPRWSGMIAQPDPAMSDEPPLDGKDLARLWAGDILGLRFRLFRRRTARNPGKWPGSWTGERRSWPGDYYRCLQYAGPKWGIRLARRDSTAALGPFGGGWRRCLGVQLRRSTVYFMLWTWELRIDRKKETV